MKNGKVLKKLDRLETHDRYHHFTNQNSDISECCQNLIDQRPFGDRPFYIFSHPRSEDDGFNKRIIWQPRLTRPLAQENSMLFKAYPGTDTIKIIWMIPERGLWNFYQSNLVTPNQSILTSINNYVHHRGLLDTKDPDDLSDEEINQIYKEISEEATRQKQEFKPISSEESP